MWNDREVRILGLMAGSSMDGIDLAICRFSPNGEWSFERAETVPISEEWQARLRQFNTLNYRDGSLLDTAFGVYLGEQIRDWLQDDTVDFIGIHGYTVIHEPTEMVSKQLGAGRAVYHTTGIPVVDGFRNEDILGGGSGAPLAPVVERDLFPETGYFVNLGGILNASVHGISGEVWARDLSGCNQVANVLAAEAGLAMDLDGRLSLEGRVIPALVEKAGELCRVLHTEVSLSNDWVQGVLLPVFVDKALPLADRLASLYTHQAEVLGHFFYENQHRARQQGCLVTGGGAWNPVLMAQIGDMLKRTGIQLEKADPITIDFKEALLIAWMAYLHIQRRPLGAWVWTGASRDHVAGTSYGVW